MNKNEYFAIIVNGTQDITGAEQESICIRHVMDDFTIREDFVGVYKMEGTTGKELQSMIKDVLLRLQLPMENIRAQTYDGAANMSGKFNGCQALIKAEQPLAKYIHCGAHCTHLIAS